MKHFENLSFNFSSQYKEEIERVSRIQTSFEIANKADTTLDGLLSHVLSDR